ncbi:hypothetical protein AKG38_21465, partial [Pectobacterium carotovorum subsp. carotovorum]|nr:hypothetical protein [Pectobacterium carotovorum subsp. carotovorum]
DIHFILIKYRMGRLLPDDRLFDGESLFLSPSTPCKVNQFIHRPTDERAAQSSLATSVTVIPLCNINMAMSRLE